MKKILFYSILVVSTACGTKDAAKEEAKAPAAVSTTLQLTDAQIKNGGIEIVDVVSAHINQTVQLNGTIDVPPQNMVSITCPMGGYIKSIDLLPGQEINKGAMLITMEDPAYIQLQQDYLVGKSKMYFLEKELERQQQLAATEASSQKVYQQTKADFDAQKAMQEALKQKLALIGIDAAQLTTENMSRTIAVRSPIHGFISKVPVNKGRYVAPTEVLAELVDPGDIHASLTVFEKDLPLIQKDQEVAVRLVAHPEKAYPADVLLVSRTIDDTRSGMVHCHFHQYSRELVPGMAVTATIELGKQMQPAVPEAAILLSKGKHFVFVQTASKQFQLVEITPGDKENGLVGISSSNFDWAGKKVVAKGAFSLLGMILKSEEEE